MTQFSLMGLTHQQLRMQSAAYFSAALMPVVEGKRLQVWVLVRTRAEASQGCLHVKRAHSMLTHDLLLQLDGHLHLACMLLRGSTTSF